MKRTIKAHKGGRTAQPPRSRITPQTRKDLDKILAASGESFADWLTKKVSEEMKIFEMQAKHAVGDVVTLTNETNRYDDMYNNPKLERRVSIPAGAQVKVLAVNEDALGLITYDVETLDKYPHSTETLEIMPSEIA